MRRVYLWKALNNDSQVFQFVLFNQFKLSKTFFPLVKYTSLLVLYLLWMVNNKTSCYFLFVFLRSPAHAQGVHVFVCVCVSCLNSPPFGPTSLPYMPAPSRPSSNPTRDYWFTHNLLFNIGEQTFQNLRNLSISVCLSQLVCAAAEGSWRARSQSPSTFSARSLSHERRAFCKGKKKSNKKNVWKISIR